ncbi:hypothetical protein [Lentzea sp.]|uniref:hypothetical protein n=1 Tax=Lentzea sp. TaxID=56099 RepID=UPI002ED1F798
MRRSSSPPPRWVRRVLVGTPLVVAVAAAVVVPLVHLGGLGVAVAVACVLVALAGAWLVRAELKADRHVTPPMAARYRALARLLDNADDREVRVDPARRYSILLRDERLRNGSVRRALLRFDQNELEGAGHGGVGTPLVFDHFSLDPARPLVRHRLDAVTITRGPDGKASIAGIPEPWQDERAVAETARLLTATAADIPPVADLDVLIAQIRSGSALAP